MEEIRPRRSIDEKKSGKRGKREREGRCERIREKRE